MVRKVLVAEEKAICNDVAVYRARGNYLQRLEQFDKAIQAYNEALKWNDSDVRSLLGRSLARAKATHYAGALEDASRAAELEPNNLTALQIRAQTEYEKCAFERALVLAHQGRFLRKLPPDFAECARHAEETVRECTGQSAEKILQLAITLNLDAFEMESMDELTPTVLPHRSRMLQQPIQQVRDISRVENQKHMQMARLMASKYLERMAHDKYFLIDLCKDERLRSANKKGSVQLQDLASNALADVEKRQCVLRERRPMYAASAIEAATRERLRQARLKRLARAQRQNTADAKRLIDAASALFEAHDIDKCLEQAEFAMAQISRRPGNLLPGKEKFLEQLHNILALAFLDQKRVVERMSESDRERRAFVLLGIQVSRDPSRDSLVHSMRPIAPPRDVKNRLYTLERALHLSARASERCYILHELARLHADSKQARKARFYSSKCQAEARAANQRAWLLNATFLLARGHVMQNNRPEARAALLEGAALARSFGYDDVAAFFDTCANVATEGELLGTDAALEKREKELVSLMQGDDLRSAAEHLFKRMSTIPAARRFSIMPGTRAEDEAPAARRASIMPRGPLPARRVRKARHPLGFQDFDY